MTTLKGIFPETKTVKGKNFIHENIRNLRRLEHFNAHKEIDGIEKLQMYNRRKIINNSHSTRNHSTLSKIGYNFQGKKLEAKDTSMIVNNEGKQPQEICKKSSVPMLKKNNICTKKVPCTSNNLLNKQTKKEHKAFLLKSTQKFHQKTSSDPSLSYKTAEDTVHNIRVKSQGIQTLDTGDIDYLYSEGVIKYARKKNVNGSEGADKNGNKDMDTSARNVRNEPSDHGDVQLLEDKSQNKNDTKKAKLLSMKEEIDFIKLNKKRISSVNKTVPQTDTNVPISNHRIGVIPKYIKNRKEIQEKAEKMKVEESDPNCPSGHVPLPASERKETLRMLRKNYQDYVNELNMMPIKVDTLRAQRRKIEIEKQLNKLEEGIKVFSRPKVYVKMNA